MAEGHNPGEIYPPQLRLVPEVPQLQPPTPTQRDYRAVLLGVDDLSVFGPKADHVSRECPDGLGYLASLRTIPRMSHLYPGDEAEARLRVDCNRVGFQTLCDVALLKGCSNANVLPNGEAVCAWRPAHTAALDLANVLATYGHLIQQLTQPTQEMPAIQIPDSPPDQYGTYL
jgi:hypothetical protein